MTFKWDLALCVVLFVVMALPAVAIPGHWFVTEGRFWLAYLRRRRRKKRTKASGTASAAAAALVIVLGSMAGCVEAVMYYFSGERSSPDDAAATTDAGSSSPSDLSTSSDPHQGMPCCSATLNGVCLYCHTPCYEHPAPSSAEGRQP